MIKEIKDFLISFFLLTVVGFGLYQLMIRYGDAEIVETVGSIFIGLIIIGYLFSLIKLLVLLGYEAKRAKKNRFLKKKFGLTSEHLVSGKTNHFEIDYSNEFYETKVYVSDYLKKDASFIITKRKIIFSKEFDYLTKEEIKGILNNFTIEFIQLKKERDSEERERKKEQKKKEEEELKRKIQVLLEASK